jgi:hypothetical protein
LNSAARSSKGTHFWFCRITLNKLKNRREKRKEKKDISAPQPLFKSLFNLTDISVD